MKRNVGTLDRIIRIIIGVVIIAIGVYYRSWWGIIGIFPLATGLIGYCGAYTLFGVSTCKVKPSEE